MRLVSGTCFRGYPRPLPRERQATPTRPTGQRFGKPLGALLTSLMAPAHSSNSKQTKTRDLAVEPTDAHSGILLARSTLTN